MKMIRRTLPLAVILLCCFSLSFFAQDISLSKSEISVQIPQGSKAKVIISDLKVEPATAGTWQISEKSTSKSGVAFVKGGQPIINKASGAVSFTPDSGACVNGQNSKYEIVFTPTDSKITPIACPLTITVVADSKTVSFSKPLPTQVLLGDDINFASGTALKIQYASGKPSTQIDLSKCTVSGYDKEATGKEALGKKTIQVSATDGTLGEFEITVMDKVVSMGLSSQKDEYQVGESFDASMYYILPVMQSGVETKRIPLTNEEVTVDLKGFSTAKSGTTAVKVTYGGTTVSKSFKVSGAGINSEMLSVGPVTPYDGKEKKPKITVAKIGAYQPVENKDYTVEYLDNINAGTGKAVVKATKENGIFSGQMEITFEIPKCDMSKLTVQTIAKQRYTGLALTPVPVLKLGTVEVPADQFKFEYENNIENGIGTAKVTFTALEDGNFTGSRTGVFNIVDNVITGATAQGEKDKITFGLSGLVGAKAVGTAGGAAVAAQNSRLVLLTPIAAKKAGLNSVLNKFDLTRAELLQTVELRLLDPANKKIILTNGVETQYRFPYPENFTSASPIEIIKITGTGEDMAYEKVQAEKLNDYFQFTHKDTGLFVIAYGLNDAFVEGTKEVVSSSSSSFSSSSDISGVSSSSQEILIGEKDKSATEDYESSAVKTSANTQKIDSFTLIASIVGLLILVLIVIIITINSRNKKDKNRIKRTNGNIFR